MNKTLMAVIAIVLLGATVLAFNPPALLLKLMANTDIVSRYAKSSYAAMLASLPEKSAALKTGEGWMISAPDGSAEFHWNPSPAPAEGEHSAVLRTPAAPFLAAGLNPKLLPDGMLRDGMLTFAVDADRERSGNNASGLETPASAFDAVIDSCRNRIGYHIQLGHFGLEFAGGNLLEWAGEPAENDLDLVFVLNPEMLIRAGVNGEQVNGWTLGTVTVHEPSGRKVNVAKFLKPFNLQ